MREIDPRFEQWLAMLPEKGYPADWIRHNIPDLRKTYEDGREMAVCPEPSVRLRDRYEEL